MPSDFSDAAWTAADRAFWTIERERCLAALAAAGDPRPYLERRLRRIDRVLVALDVLVPLPAFSEGVREVGRGA